MGRLTAIVIGSAAGGAFPQWNCRCPVCTLAWAGDSRVKPRTQTSLAVSANDGRWTLINASPDLTAGLLSLRESTAFKLYATPASHAALAANAMFGAIGSMSRHAVNPGAS